jgi:hypothetical protein
MDEISFCLCTYNGLNDLFLGIFPHPNPETCKYYLYSFKKGSLQM